MTSRLKKPCSQPGCNVLITTGAKCPKHTKQTHVDYRLNRTDKEEQAFYNSGVWRKASKEYRAEHPICEECQERPSQLVHHKKHVRQGGARLDKRNFQAVCRKCQALAHHGNK